MKNHILKLKKLLKDERGATITVLMLVILPMLIIGLVSLTENTNILRGSNTTLQNAVTVISRHSAMMINAESQAKGDPLIAHKKAYDLFLNELNYTLGADIEGTTLENIKYWMLIYNGRYTYKGYSFGDETFTSGEGDNPYDIVDELEEVKSFAYYSNVDSNEITDDHIDFPRTFYVSDSGILDYEVEGSVKVTLKHPGVLLVLNADINPLIVNQKENVTRWAYATIIKK